MASDAETLNPLPRDRILDLLDDMQQTLDDIRTVVAELEKVS